MIAIVVERCDGCGRCLEVCPNGAIYLVEGKAVVDASLCRDCESCIAACPTGAIVITEQAEPTDAVRVPMRQPEPRAVQIRTQPAPVPLRAKVLPAVGAALVWTGREIVPRLLDIVLDSLTYQATEKRTAGTARDVPDRSSSGRGNEQGKGGRRRRRRRQQGN